VREAAASRAVASHVGLDLAEIAVSGMPVPEGEILGRNALLVHLAMTLMGQAPGTVVLGIHAGTGYRDCTPAFVGAMQDLLDFHKDGIVRIHAPFVTLSKKEVFDLAVSCGVPLHLTWSCEVSGSAPCRLCPSCRDMELLNAGR
jgi:7-cyano-7-deazaguanine synthase